MLMINESSLSMVEIGLDFDFKAFYIKEEKRKKRKERNERESAQMGEMDFADTQIEERERE
jgi:hypothetical protein